MTQIPTLGDVFPVELARVKKLYANYVEAGVARSPSGIMIQGDIQKAEAAARDGDVAAMFDAYRSLKGWTS